MLASIEPCPFKRVLLAALSPDDSLIPSNPNSSDVAKAVQSGNAGDWRLAKMVPKDDMNRFDLEIRSREVITPLILLVVAIVLLGANWLVRR